METQIANKWIIQVIDTTSGTLASISTALPFTLVTCLITGTSTRSTDMRLLRDDLRHFETLVRDTDTVCAHPDELNKKCQFGSEVERSPDTSEQPQPPKHGRRDTDTVDPPDTGRVDRPSAVGEDHFTYMRMGSPGSLAPTYHAANTQGPTDSRVTASNR